MIKSIKQIGLYSLTFFIVACGSSGGGDSTPTSSTAVTQSNTTTYKAMKPDSWTPGTQYTFSLSGSDNLGINYTGTLSWSKRHDATYSSTTVSQVDSYIHLQDSYGASISGTTSVYRDITTGWVEATVTNSTGVICTPTNAVFVDNPDTLQAGQTGTGYSYTCSDGSTRSSSWRTESGINGWLKLVLSSTFRDQYGNIEITEDDSVYIDIDGVPQAIDVRMTIFDTTNIIITLSSY